MANEGRDPALEAYAETYTAAARAAAQRIVPNRRKMSVAEARSILRLEFERRGIRLSAEELERADRLRRGPLWPIVHPIQAAREQRRSRFKR